MSTTQAMIAKSVTPHFLTTKVDEAQAFYTRYLGFQTTFHRPGGYVGLRSGGNEATDIAFMAPPPGVPAPSAAGVFYGILVEDADREHARLVEAGVEVVDEPEDQPWGGRRMTLRDPSGILVMLFHPIEPTDEFKRYAVE